MIRDRADIPAEDKWAINDLYASDALWESELDSLEKDKEMEIQKENMKSIPKNNYQLSMFELDPKFQEAKELIEAIDINAISPIEALLKLHEIKKKVEE